MSRLPKEFHTFTSLVDRLLTVPKADLDRRVLAEKERPRSIPTGAAQNEDEGWLDDFLRPTISHDRAEFLAVARGPDEPARPTRPVLDATVYLAKMERANGVGLTLFAIGHGKATSLCGTGRHGAPPQIGAFSGGAARQTVPPVAGSDSGESRDCAHCSTNCQIPYSSARNQDLRVRRLPRRSMKLRRSGATSRAPIRSA